MDSERYRQLVEQTSDWVWQVDAQGVYVYVSPKVQDLLGYTPDELLGKTPFDLMPADEARRVRAIFAEYVGNRAGFFALENVNLHKRGHRVTLETSGVPIFDASGQLLGYRGIDRDVSERKQVEAELRRAKEMAERNAMARSRIVSFASHDLRQPLQSLGLYMSLLRKQLGPAPAVDTIDRMQRIVQSMGSLLDRFLDDSSLAANMGNPRLRRFCLTERLQAVVSAAEPLAREKNLSLRLRAQPLWVESDPDLFDRILENLVFNALKYTHQGGVLLSVRRRKAGLRLDVWDTGPGMDDQSIARIFDEFVQLEQPLPDVGAGLGLGLAIVKRAAELLGCRIDVRSRRGRGSVFTLWCQDLDAGISQSDAIEFAEPASEAVMTADILLVEDDEDVADSMRMLLQESGFRISLAASGEAVFELLDDAGYRPDLVITDFRLPGDFDGVAVLAGVNARRDVPVPGLIITGDSLADNPTTDLTDQYLVLAKPVEWDQLLAAVRRLLPQSASKRSQ